MILADVELGLKLLEAFLRIVEHQERAVDVVDVRRFGEARDERHACRRLRARETNAYGGAELKRLESLALIRLGVPDAPLARAPAKRACQAIVKEHASKAGLAAVPDCERSWALYRVGAERAFAAYDADAAHASAPSRTVIRPFYEGPLFEEKK